MADSAAGGSTTANHRTTVERSFRAMNTDVHIVVVPASGDSGRAALDAAEEAVHDRETRWSRFLPDSELSIINRSGGRPVIVADDTFALICRAVDAWRLTGGVFDPTIGSSVLAAGYDRSFEHLANAEPVTCQTPVPAATPTAIRLHEATRSVVAPAGVILDLGGIAKGATCDAVTAELRSSGVAGCCVNIGGDLRVAGTPPDPRGWTVTLDCPGSPERRAIALADGAVCTSTVTKRRWRTTNGPEHHLRDPATGAHFDTGIASVSVIAARAEQAEVLTKVAIAAGPDEAGASLAVNGATGLLVHTSGALTELDGFADFVLSHELDPRSSDAQ
jgi:thiamine biosynthesis lipoprotein